MTSKEHKTTQYFYNRFMLISSNEKVLAQTSAKRSNVLETGAMRFQAHWDGLYSLLYWDLDLFVRHFCHIIRAIFIIFLWHVIRSSFMCTYIYSSLSCDGLFECRLRVVAIQGFFIKAVCPHAIQIIMHSKRFFFNFWEAKLVICMVYIQGYARILCCAWMYVFAIYASMFAPRVLNRQFCYMLFIIIFTSVNGFSFLSFTDVFKCLCLYSVHRCLLLRAVYILIVASG